MELHEQLRNQAKLDSRRFGKGVVCRIIVGPLLDIMYKEGMVPGGVYINKNGLDPVNNKMFVIPSITYPDIAALVKDYQTVVSTETSANTDFEAVESTTQSRSGLLRALKQNIILITMNINMPQGKQAGLDPNYYDVLIDSVDVNQTIEGVYVYRTKENIRKQENWND